jgi:hypothetical protein
MFLYIQEERVFFAMWTMRAQRIDVVAGVGMELPVPGT